MGVSMTGVGVRQQYIRASTPTLSDNSPPMLVHEQEAPPVLNGPVMPRRCKLQHLASLGFRYFG